MLLDDATIARNVTCLRARLEKAFSQAEAGMEQDILASLLSALEPTQARQVAIDLSREAMELADRFWTMEHPLPSMAAATFGACCVIHRWRDLVQWDRANEYDDA